MITLGIETSCDETSCAVLKGKDRILSNLISSSLFRHKPFGGVVPEIASRHCLEQIDVVYEEALKQARIQPEKIDLIAVTEGPGLIGSLLVGISFAKALAYHLKKPLIGVNHLEAHLVANFISAKGGGGGKREPGKYVGLLVSGGHTSLSYHERGKIKLLGATVDDAVGEAYDKVAKMMGLGYPGGPILDKLARKGNPDAFQFTKPKQKGRFGRDSHNRGTPLGRDTHRFDFSFSGIKTAVMHLTQRVHVSGYGGIGVSEKKAFHPDTPTPRYSDTFIQDLAASFQKSVVSWLVEKTLDAAHYKKVNHIVVGGGVSANSALRATLTEEGRKQGIQVDFPPFLLTMDNAGMIARRGYELYKRGRRASLRLSGNANLRMGVTV